MVGDTAACYKALCAKDSRFDGLFFVGVSSTGIYCRCVCPAKTPRALNCTFFPNPSSAEEAGFRPCLRCRPENAPGRANVDAVRSTARRAARLIEGGYLHDKTLQDLAASLGVSDRQLRRTMQIELGVQPVQLAQTCRLLSAKKMLTDTRSPMCEVACAAGFKSVRRFNAAMQERYHLTPSDLRRSPSSGASSFVTSELSFRPPFEFEEHLKFLGKRSIEGVEFINDVCYSRGCSIAGHTGWFRVTRGRGPNTLHIQISDSLVPVLPRLINRVRHMFDVDADPMQIEHVLAGQAEANPGLRLPTAFDGFESAVRAILGQQVTVSFATVLASRVASTLGTAMPENPAGLQTLFPSAEKVAQCSQDDFGKLGIVGLRARAIIALAEAVCLGRLALSPLAEYEPTRDTLLGIPGIGPWTAEYICMRSLGYPDAFPAHDLGVLKALGTRDPREALAWAEKYRPWRSYAAMHLWRSLSAKEPV